jgi:uncharacterized membrane protein
METLPDDKIKTKERFIRWQGILREHITFVNNLILTISVTIVGFLLTLLNDSKFSLSGYNKFFFTLGLIFNFISILIGLCAIFSRLFDFRLTLKKISNEIQDKTQSELDNFKSRMYFYGKTTWNLLYWQVGTFFAGSIIIILAFTCIYSDKLF